MILSCIAGFDSFFPWILGQEICIVRKKGYSNTHGVHDMNRICKEENLHFPSYSHLRRHFLSRHMSGATSPEVQMPVMRKQSDNLPILSHWHRKRGILTKVWNLQYNVLKWVWQIVVTSSCYNTASNLCCATVNSLDTKVLSNQPVPLSTHDGWIH